MSCRPPAFTRRPLPGQDVSVCRPGEIRPLISVVIPAYQASSTLPAVLDALAPQVDRPDREAILVDSSGDGHAEALAAARPWLDVLALPARTLPGGARNLGVERSRGQYIAFLDADAVPDAGWLDGLAVAMTDEVDVVAGAVLNGTRHNPIGSAGYLLEFAEWMPGRRGTPAHGATCSLLIRRNALMEAGGFLEDLFPGEDTLLTFPFGEAGRLAFARNAAVTHLNRTGVTEFLRHQHRLGSSFRVLSQRTRLGGWQLVRPALVPFAIAGRAIHLADRLRPDRREAARAVALLPVLVPGLMAWAVGVVRGGEGRARVGSPGATGRASEATRLPRPEPASE